MFRGCSKISDIVPLSNWNLLNGKNFDSMFLGCKLSGREKLENWNIPDEVYTIF
jgi:hypothetical protein